jgi:aminopeptidase N
MRVAAVACVCALAASLDTGAQEARALDAARSIVRDGVAHSTMTIGRGDVHDFTRLLHGVVPGHAAVADAPVSSEPDLAPGVSHALARWRTARVDIDTIDLHVALDLAAGLARIHSVTRARRLDRSAPLVLDWRPDAGPRDAIVATLDGVTLLTLPIRDGHVVIDTATLGDREFVTLAFDTVAPLATGGGPLTRFRDPVDGSEYVWSLFVPVDASRVWPCMDQPDLKARVALTVDAPVGWRVIGNAAVEGAEAIDLASVRHTFARTAPLSTYLVAFAAGPFEALPGEFASLQVRRSRLADAQREHVAIVSATGLAMADVARRFAQPFAWGKHDVVALPDFPYGGMEHAGATFVRESVALLPAEATAVERLRRTQLLAHETVHQWFGDLVTMRWFDDLWLKEGFANRLAFEHGDADPPGLAAVAAVTRRADAMRADLTPGSVPVWRPLDNLLDAKAMYGPIVYQKAPWVIDQWMDTSPDPGAALRAYLRDHRFGVADRDDLIAAFGAHAALRPGFTDWMRTWITQPGVITVEPEWQVAADGSVAGVLHFEAPSRDGPWAIPPRLGLDVLSRDTSRAVVLDLAAVEAVGPGRWRLSWRAEADAVAEAPRLIESLGVLPFEGGREWLRWRMDAKTAANASRLAAFARLPDRAHLRAFEALWDRLHDARMSPEAWLEQAVPLVAEPRGAWVTAQHGARIERVLRAGLSAKPRAAWAPRVEAAWLARIDASTRPDVRRPPRPAGPPFREQLPASFERITELDARDARREAWRAFIAVASTPEALAHLQNWLDGRDLPDGIAPTARERFAIARTLIRENAPGAAEALAQLRAAHTDRDAQRWAYAAAAATPDVAAKSALLDAWITDATIPDAWIEEALPAWASPEHAAITEPLLPRALEALPHLARTRSIFVVNRWLEAIVGGQVTASARDVVRAFAERPTLAPEMRDKVREHLDALERVVRWQDSAREAP